MHDTAVLRYPFSDRALAARLERMEATANAAFVESRARLQPEIGASWIEVAGAYAMYDGVTSPLTQTFGLGLHEDAGPAALDELESFFHARGAPVYHEVSPMADAGLVPLLGERGYRPVELTSVLHRPLQRERVRLSGGPVRVRLLEPDDAELWASVAAEGWSDEPGLAAFMHELARVSAGSENSHPFLASIDGQPVAAGALSIGDGVALLAGASTIPRWRGRGAQLALLAARLQFAAEHGCELAMIAAAPGSASQRNAERHGFRIAYTRIKWHLFTET